MNRLTKHVVALWMALLFVGVSSQAAVCDLVCAPAVHRAGCAAEAHAATPRAMAMPGMHCAGRMAAPPMRDGLVRLGNQQACRHAPVYALADSSPQRAATSAVAWWVVEILPVRLNLRGGRRAVDPDDPVPFHPVDPLLVSLRV